MESRLTTIVSQLDQTEVSRQVQIESRNREVHLPPVSVYRWWARRTEAVNGAILDAAVDTLGSKDSLLVADPFAGGGVIPMAALSRGHRVYAQDLNSWVAEGLSTALGLPSVDAIETASAALFERLKPVVAEAYATKLQDGSDGQVSQTFRVAIGTCSNCGQESSLYPHALVSRLRRVDRKPVNKKPAQAYLACLNGHLYKGKADKRSKCPDCQEVTDPYATYLPKRTHTCRACGHSETLEQMATVSGLAWKVVLVERSAKGRREIGEPTVDEIEQASCEKWSCKIDLGKIPNAHETRVLSRHGYKFWSDLYPDRQRFVTEKALAEIGEVTKTISVQKALRMAVLGTTEMAGYLSRWDRYYLKSYESMASHRFNFTTFTAEPNIIGLNAYGRGTLSKRVSSLRKAAAWLKAQDINMPYRSPINADNRKRRQVSKAPLNIVCGSSERMLLADATVDLILTDPPYHDDVQYHELSLPFRAWAGLPMERSTGEAVAIPHSADLDGHITYRDQLIPIFSEFARVLKPTGRLVFSYANRESAAWVNLFAALRAARLRPFGFTIVHSENETESSKQQGRSCNLDLVLELVPTTHERLTQWKPKPVFNTDEESYLLAVGDAFLESFSLVNGWEQHLVGKLKSEIFVSSVAKEPNVEDEADTRITVNQANPKKSKLEIKREKRASAAVA